MSQNDTNYGEIADEKGSFRDHIGTINEDGDRKWIYPRKPKGPFYTKRKITAWILLVLLFGIPFIKINGEPMLLFNIIERKFVIFGSIFWPQDFFIFVLAMLTSIVFVLLFTTAFGRIFCGWICPQTIFLEMVFRRIEYLIEGDFRKQKKLDKMPWNTEKVVKKTSKNILFALISVVIAHTFLSYVVGYEQVFEIMSSSPADNPGGFAAMVVFTALFYGVFARFREQACIIVCPYGRLQGALLDNKSIVVAYDFVRGESTTGRSTFKKGENREEVGKGDCIDCNACVEVCPTGIDIRNGTQLECVNCTACIDACDDIMLSINKPKGLIRYASIENIEKKEPFKFTPRLIAYTSILGLLLSVLVMLISLRAPVEVTVLRKPGTTFQKLDDGLLRNLYTYKIINKTNGEITVNLEMEGMDAAHLELPKDVPSVPKGGSVEGTVYITVNRADITEYKTKIKINVIGSDGVLTTVKTTFLGPMR